MKWKCPNCKREYIYKIDPFPKIEVEGNEIRGTITLVAICVKCSRADIKKAKIRGKIIEIFGNG